METLVVAVTLYLLGVFALYWVIRLAVRHGTEDVLLRHRDRLLPRDGDPRR